MGPIKVNITGGNIITSTWCWLQLFSLASFFYLSFFSEGDDDHHHDHHCNALIPSHNVEHADEITTSDQVSEMFDENIFSPEYAAGEQKESCTEKEDYKDIFFPPVVFVDIFFLLLFLERLSWDEIKLG